tara:strand:- start:1839 stop:2357 length:519 start_codon:yes stop_codon:yes gene_type:complete
MNTYQCLNDIITKDERKQLLYEVKNIKVWDDYSDTSNLKVVSTGKGTLPLKGLVKKLINKVNPKLKFWIADFIKFAPKKGIVVHKDDLPGRTSCITWALSPSLDKFSPIKYYDENEKFVEEVYYKEKPLIITTQNNHNCFNDSEEIRYTFQICFYDKIEKLVELDQKGKLFI